MLYDNLSVSPEGHLTFAGCDTTQLAQTYGTPLLVMDENRIRSRCRVYREAMAAYLPAGSYPLYASKALSMKRMYEIVREETMGVDVVSAGELYTALQAGFPMDKVYFHGSSKTDSDIRFAIESRVGFFVCDNADELDAINAEAARQGVRQKLLLRLSPGIDPHTHQKINTGRVDSKFGVAIETGQAEALVQRALSKEYVELVGYHCHVGSQLFDEALFCDSAAVMLTFVQKIAEKYGFVAQVLNLGGGMGVPYTEHDRSIDYAAVIAEIGEIVRTRCESLGISAPRIILEPGRSLVAAAGVTLYTVGSVKEIPGFRNYVSVDGGMPDNPRYALYQSRYTALIANRAAAPRDYVATVAGRCCESGDLIGEGMALQHPERGDILAVLTTGAYNYAMASNYNRLPRPPIVMIADGHARLAVKRERFEDLVRNDCE